MGYGSTISASSSAVSSAERDRADWHERASGLYEELRRPATVLIRRAYGSAFGEPEIEDIYSNAWLGTLRALERKAHDLSDDEVRSYLLTAVANHASKEIRRRKRKPVAPLEAAGAISEQTDSLHELAEATESRSLTRDLLASLPPRRRAVMLLRYGWGDRR
jgi:RNA polymerase sigma factor (sigma-70 family)